MARSLTEVRNELSQTLKLSIPIVIAQVGQYLMSLIDTWAVGKIGPAELGGVGAAGTLMGGTLAVGLGLLLSLDTCVSQALGAGDRPRARLFLVQGLWLSAYSALAFGIFLYWTGHHFDLTGAAPEVIGPAEAYLRIAAWSTFPALGFIALNRYWQAYQVVWPIMLLTLVGNIINLIADLAFVLGRWGFPQSGAAGVAWATLVCRWAMFLGLALFTVWKIRAEEPAVKATQAPLVSLTKLKWQFDLKLQKTLLRLGGPAGFQIFLEVGAFVGATLLASRLGAVPLAAHHVVLSIASIAFMFPLGFSSATAVRVGYWTGGNDSGRAALAGWIGIGVAAAFMTFSATLLFFFSDALFRFFSADPAVFESGQKVILLVVLFQIFDGIQVSTIGALRGIGDTQTPAWVNLIGHYPLGLLLGGWLCFSANWGLFGLWVGLASGLMFSAVGLVYFWRRKSSPRFAHLNRPL